MTNRWKQALVVIAVLVLAVAVVQAGVKVRAEFDKEYDFSKVRTFGWHPDGAGEVKLLMREGGDPEQIRARWEPTIKDAVAQELTKRGLAAATSGVPDLYLNYYFLSGPNSEAQTRGRGCDESGLRPPRQTGSTIPSGGGTGPPYAGCGTGPAVVS